jgi:hypothetical protein
MTTSAEAGRDQGARDDAAPGELRRPEGSVRVEQLPVVAR